jgi:hypothetical protein
MTISRKAEICGWSGLTHPGRHDTFPAHDERMRYFRRNHGGTAGVDAAIMMRLPLYVMPSIEDYGGSAELIDAMDLSGLLVMKRLPPRILTGN